MQRTPRLRELRERAALSQEDLAERCNVARATIADLEAGKRPARPSTLRKLAKGLDVDVTDLFGGSERPLGGAPPSPSLSAAALDEVPPEDASLKEWLKKHNARRAIMSDAEVLENFERMASGSDGTAVTNRFEQETRSTFTEEAEVDGALATEFAHGGVLLPKVESGPDLVKRASARHKRYTSLKRHIRNRYNRYYRALESYNTALFAGGRTSDFVMVNRRPQMIQAMRAAIRALEEDARDEAG